MSTVEQPLYDEIDPLGAVERISVTMLSQVFVQEHVSDERALVMKLALRGAVSIASIINEADIVPQIGSPYVLPILSSGTILDRSDYRHGLPYIITPYVARGTLEAKKRTDPDDINEATHAISDTARGLKDTHEAGYVHGDVKINNILVPPGRNVLSDFGSASKIGAVRGPEIPELEGKFLGTISYLAPEQCAQFRLQPKTDVFGLAMSAYVSLTGELPWTGAEDEDILKKLGLVKTVQIVADGKQNHKLPKSLSVDARDLIYQGLNYQVMKRPPVEDFINL